MRSKLTARSQTTVPRAVRAALGIRAGDVLVYKIEGRRAILTRARSGRESGDADGTFCEWNTEADARAYSRL